MQVGNGNFAFGADITGLQTFQPFGTLSSWGWKNDSLPAGKTWEDVENYKGVGWLNHGRPVQYDFGGERPIEQWLISNPNRLNLARIGLVLLAEDGTVKDLTEDDLSGAQQSLDLWTGIITSTFTISDTPVQIETFVHDTDSIVGINVTSPLVTQRRLAVFLDFPWNDGSAKFSAPFVGRFNETDRHSTDLDADEGMIVHKLVNATTYTRLGGDEVAIKRDTPTAHRYTLLPANPTSASFLLSAHFSAEEITSRDDVKSIQDIKASTVEGWEEFWTQSGFVDVSTGSTDPRADELQRRIMLSRYLERVNGSGDTPPQESGLVNNGWYGKFHMEMFFWHSAHWALWNNWDILNRVSDIYARFLPSALARAQVQQGWDSGARWPKMTDPSGRSAPGEINNLLLWQQPHPLIFALHENRSFPSTSTLEKWAPVLRETANFMASFAHLNTSTSVYDLGPPAHLVSEDTSPNATLNPAFELAYWRLGLGIAEQWMSELGEDVPEEWSEVRESLAPLPQDKDGLYAVYEGIDDGFWTDPAYTNDHPALVGLHGWLPPTPGLDLERANRTAVKVWDSWNRTEFWGWDFPVLAMSAARNGMPSEAVDFLLDPLFQFDDVGMPIGGRRVATPYFPSSGGLLYAVAFMAAGWDGVEGERVAQIGRASCRERVSQLV